MTKKLVLLSGCILNNIESESSRELVNFFAESGVGIVQMPCPKFASQFNSTGSYRNHCKTLSEKLVAEMKKYMEEYRIVGIVGIEYSKNCGVYKFRDGKKGWGKGVFFNELEKQMEKIKLQIPFFGIDSNNPLRTLRRFQLLLKNS